MSNSKRKKKIVKPKYTTKAVRVKQTPKKPIPKELKYGLAFCGAALVIAIVLVIALYNDGSLAMNDEGMPIMEANNWLIANKGSSSEPKYYKIGEINPIEGFAVDETELDDISTNMRIYIFNPDDPDSQISQYYVTATDRQANANAETANSNYRIYSSLQIGDVQTATMDGQEVHYFTAVLLPSSEQAEETDADSTTDTDAAAEETQTEAPQQQLLAYIPAKRDTTILVSVTLPLSEEVSALTDEALLDILQDIMDQIVVDE